MTVFYSPSTGNCYIQGTHTQVPADVVEISDERYQSVIANPEPGKIRSHDDAGLPILVDPPEYVPTTEQLCAEIDQAADAARTTVAGDPLRAVEYERAAAEAQVFADAGYPADVVPRTVAAWAINGRTPQQAAASILAENAAYTEALYQIRETRLSAKEQARAAMAAGNIEQAQSITAEAVASIQASIGGVGNAGA